MPFMPTISLLFLLEYFMGQTSLFIDSLAPTAAYKQKQWIFNAGQSVISSYTYKGLPKLSLYSSST